MQHRQTQRSPRQPARQPAQRSGARLWGLASLALLAFAGWQIAGTLARSPAFNRSLQVETIEGRGVLRQPERMFASADYYSWTALEWDLKSSVTPARDGNGAGAAEAEAGTRQALAIATESLRHNPSDAGAWMIVARARARLGADAAELEAALEALGRARVLSPNSAAQARDRLMFLAQFMRSPAGERLALAEIAPADVAQDLMVLTHSEFYAPAAARWSRNPALAPFGLPPLDP